jgi:hypothetical protein
MRKLTRRTAVIAAGVAVATTASLAFAAWTSNGSGTGTAASTTDALSAIAGVSPVAADDLYPGATKTAKVTVSNPNSYPVVVTKINAGASRVVNVSCAASTVRTDALGDGTNAVTQSLGGTVIAPGGSGTYTLTLRMSNDPDNTCKSQTFVIGDGTTPTDAMTATLKSAATAQSF